MITFIWLQHHSELSVLFLPYSARDNITTSNLYYYSGRIRGYTNLKRGVSTWIKDYSHRNPTYLDYAFRRRFSIPIILYFCFWHDIQHGFEYWKQRVNGLDYK